MKTIPFYILLIAFCASCKNASPPDNSRSDDFPRSTPEAQGVATEGILRLMETAADSGIELHSFMMLRKGRVIAEAWWHPYRRDIPHIMYSMSKTVTATAIGFAVQEGLLTVNDPVISFFPDDLPEDISPNLQKLTIKHLLTMSDGMERPPAFTAEDHRWAKTYLAHPVVYEPGSRFYYSSFASFMLSAIIRKTTGMNTLAYLTPRFFEPLNIPNPKWEVNAEGIDVGGWGLQLTTIDMAKIGQFYLQKGVWNGKRLLSEAWIDEATSAHIYQRPDRTDEENANDEGAQGYGYQLWLSTNGAYRMDGARGQLVVVLPEKETVIVTTANTNHSNDVLHLLREHIYPVIFSERQKADEMTAAMYGDYISSLELPRPFITPDDLSPRKSGQQSYQLDPNELGIEKVTFDFLSDGDFRFTFTQKGKQFDFLFGWDRWRYGETAKPGPYFLRPARLPDGLAPFVVCGYGSWLTADNLSFRLLYMTEVQHEDYICHFTEEGITIHVSNSVQKNNPPVELRGKFE